MSVAFYGSTLGSGARALDVKATFLHGELEEDILISQADEFAVPGEEDHARFIDCKNSYIS